MKKRGGTREEEHSKERKIEDKKAPFSRVLQQVGIWWIYTLPPFPGGGFTVSYVEGLMCIHKVRGQLFRFYIVCHLFQHLNIILSTGSGK